MDFNQDKLTKNEWNGTEIPISKEEKEILQMIRHGYHDVNYNYNKNQSLLGILKIEPSDDMMNYLYATYFDNLVQKMIKRYDLDYKVQFNAKKKAKKGDMMKIQNAIKDISKIRGKVYEYTLLDVTEYLLNAYYEDDDTLLHEKYYTLFSLLKNNITKINTIVLDFIQFVLSEYKEEINTKNMFEMADQLIEKNNILHQYSDIRLYEHQKRLFTVCKNPDPKLVLYIAPTGTGKTMSPIGLSESHKIIFVCAARHVGLALAKSAISMEKKVAFAFGCNSVEDIRLHYFAAKDYSVDKRTGRIYNVDNSNGANVQIMITDIKSYLSAMYYMKAFNEAEDLILYWDEPTISMDYEEHEFHKYISENWQKNIIPNIILSSATLPQEEELIETIGDFRSKHEDSNVYNIVSHDCNKSIPLVNKENYVELPHLKYQEYQQFRLSINHCKNYKTLLRYYDLKEIIAFISYMDTNGRIANSRLSIEDSYSDINNLTMNQIKIHYLELLDCITEDEWSDVYMHFQNCRKPKYDSSIYVATKDAHTLTDGPTIFLSENVEKIAKFILQTSKIPEKVMSDLMEHIDFNDKILKTISVKEKELEDSLGKDAEKENKMSDNRLSPEQKKLQAEINSMLSVMKTITLNDLFVPNKLEHLRYWNNTDIVDKEFSCNIEPNIVERIMLLQVDNIWKILLIMGIGVFTNHTNKDYTEIMKELADKQHLYLIIASTDYIYGTNYQFCHGYISKDLENMSQEKTIQALGRIGRNQLHKEYSIRFRDDGLIDKLFMKEENKPEVINMNKLFNTPM